MFFRDSFDRFMRKYRSLTVADQTWLKPPEARVYTFCQKLELINLKLPVEVVQSSDKNLWFSKYFLPVISKHLIPGCLTLGKLISEPGGISELF